MNNNLHLITKILFDPEYYYPERLIKIKTGDYITNGIIVSNDEEELTVVSVQKILSEDEFKNEPTTTTIHAEQVSSGDVELILPDEAPVSQKALDNIYVAFRETSNLLCETEMMLAEKSKVKDTSEIESRNESRLVAFQKLIENIKE